MDPTAVEKDVREYFEFDANKFDSWAGMVTCVPTKLIPEEIA